MNYKDTLKVTAENLYGYRNYMDMINPIEDGVNAVSALIHLDTLDALNKDDGHYTKEEKILLETAHNLTASALESGEYLTTKNDNIQYIQFPDGSVLEYPTIDGPQDYEGLGTYYINQEDFKENKED